MNQSISAGEISPSTKNLETEKAIFNTTLKNELKILKHLEMSRQNFDLKIQLTPNAGKDMAQQEVSFTAGGNEK